MIEEQVRQFLKEHGLSIAAQGAGGAIGGAVGAAVLGPVGAVLSGLLGNALGAAGEGAVRLYERREKERLGEAGAWIGAYALLAAQRRGQIFDETTNSGETGRLVEAALAVAKDERESSKVRHVAAMTAELTVASFPLDDALVLIDIAERMSFRQMLMLRALTGPELYAVPENDAARAQLAAEQVNLDLRLETMIRDIHALEALGLIQVAATIMRYQAAMDLTEIGKTMSHMLHLADVDVSRWKAFELEYAAVAPTYHFLTNEGHRRGTDTWR